MALTLIHTPQHLAPVYSPMWYKVSSTLYTENNFRYVFDTYVTNITANTTTKIHRSKLFPRSDGTGLYSPSRILENYVTYDFDFFGFGFQPAIQSITGFNVKVGEEYDLSGSTYSFSSTTNNGGFVRYNFTNPVTFLSGDEVKIDLANKAYNSSYDGLQTVTTKTSNSITTNKAYGDVVSNESGDCIYRLTMLSGVSYSGVAINFAAQYFDNVDNIAYYPRYGMSIPFPTDPQPGQGLPLTNIDYPIR
jgi:hypothetical protein